jgi:predicted lipoprotein with Yx(FWY)xxD motif
MAFQRRVAPMGVTAAGLALTGLALAGCGAVGTALPSGLDNGDGYGKPVRGDQPSTVPGNGVPANGAPATITSLHVGPAGPLGSVVVDNAGRTLYRYDGDRSRPSASLCTGNCARVWPPVRWSPDLRIAPEIPRARVGSVRRPDGTLQVTISGWPLYRYARDTAPGDVNGQGMGGGWSASRPNGTKAAFTVGTPPPPGYGQGTGGVVIGEDGKGPSLPPSTSAPPGAAPGSGGTPSQGP